MTPPAATVAGRTTVRRPTGTVTRPARRTAGPARPMARGSVAVPAGLRLGDPVGLRVARRLAALPDARVLDRLIRGRLWIGLLAAGLIGIVFMQISLLKLNTGIGRAVQTAQTLDQQNDAMRVELSRMGGGARVQDRAGTLGYVVPASGQPRFLDARRASAARAAASISAPAPVAQLPLGMIPPQDGGTAGAAPVVTAATPQAAAGAVTAATPASGAALTSGAPQDTAVPPPIAAPVPTAAPAVPAPAAQVTATARTVVPATTGGLAAPKG